MNPWDKLIAHHATSPSRKKLFDHTYISVNEKAKSSFKIEEIKKRLDDIKSGSEHTFSFPSLLEANDTLYDFYINWYTPIIYFYFINEGCLIFMRFHWEPTVSSFSSFCYPLAPFSISLLSISANGLYSKFSLSDRTSTIWGHLCCLTIFLFRAKYTIRLFCQ